MNLAAWLKPYLASALHDAPNAQFQDDGPGRVLITIEEGRPDRPAVTRINMHLAPKVLGELQVDIAAGNQKAQDVIGQHFADKLTKYRMDVAGGAVSDADITIGIKG